jgi:hypothetical protein
MDYQKAQQLKNQGLLSLIAQKKFKEGQGLGSSITGAISDKFTARATRFKEKLDPLNWLSSMVGKGIIGRSVTTVAGRAFGRSEQDIGYFGGYKRNKNYRKDPKRTTIGSGPITAIRVGDSSADILGKMYNFMEKTHELYKKNYEIEKSHREEQMEEDERRHKKLIEQLLKSYTKSTTIPEEKKEEKEPTWIDKMLDGLKSSLAFIMAPITKIIGFFKGIGSLLSSIIGGLGSIIFGIIKDFSAEIVGLLFTPLKSLVQGIVSNAFKMFASAAGGIIGMIPGLGLAIKAVLIALAAGNAEVAYLNEMFNLQTGGEFTALEDEWSKYERRKLQEIADMKSLLDNAKDPVQKKILNKQITDAEAYLGKDNKSRKQKNLAQRNNLIESTNELIPGMEKQGYKPRINPNSQTGDFERYPDGRLKFFNKDGDEPGLNELSIAKTGKSWMELKKDEAIDVVAGYADKLGGEFSNRAKIMIQEKLPNFLKPNDPPANDGKPASDIIIKGQNNIGGSAPKIINNDVLLSRNINPTYRKTQMQLAVAV